MRARENFFVSEAATVRSVQLGVAWLYQWGDPTREGIIVVPTKRQFEGTQLAEAIGRAPASALAKGKTIRAPGGRTIRGHTIRTFPKYDNLGPVLALWAGGKSLDQPHDGYPAALCVVPWLLDEVTPWARAVGAVDLLGVRSPSASPSIADPVVRRALESLTLTVNLSTGLAHPSDKAAAIEMFRILKKGKHTWTGEDVSICALAAGWNARHARELAEMAAGIAAGRSYRSGVSGSSWASDILAQWRRASDEQ